MTDLNNLAFTIVLFLFIAFVCVAYMARRERVSLRAWLVMHVLVRMLYPKSDDLNRFRMLVDRNRRAGPALPNDKLHRRYCISQDESEGMRILRVRRNSGAAAARIIYLHGGAYVFDLIPPQWALIRGLIDRIDIEIVVVLYPLAPSGTARNVLPRLASLYRREARNSHLHPTGLAGDSAGGGLALALTHYLRDNGETMPSMLTLFYPWFDVTLSDPEQAHLNKIDLTLSIPQLREAGQLWAGDLPPNHPSVSPLFASEHGGIPPTLVQFGGRDLLSSDARRFSKLCPQAEITEYPGMMHGWICTPIPEATAALDEASGFIADILANRPRPARGGQQNGKRTPEAD